MLNFLSQGNQKKIVGISLVPGLGLEAVVIDKNKNVITNYGRKKVDYNFSAREIKDYVQFKVALTELMDSMKIPPKSAVYVVLPNVYFDFIQIPENITDAEIKTMILSQAEQSYLFKREEPMSGWYAMQTPGVTAYKRVAYSSFQKTTVDSIREIINDLGLQLIGVESAYSATIRGLSITGLIDDVILEQASWMLMMINTNSYTLFTMSGKDLIDCREVPVAVKSLSTEEAYQAIVSSSAQYINKQSTSKLYILSQIDEISSDVLKRQIDSDKEIVAIDTNKYSQAPLLDVLSATDFNDANAVTPSGIGAAIILKNQISLNVLADDPSIYLGVYFTTTILGTTIDVTSQVIMKACLALSVLLILILGGVTAILSIADSNMQKTISSMNIEIDDLDKKIQAEEQNNLKPNVNIYALIDEIANDNIVAMNFYDAIATNIPNNVWLTKYYNKNGNQIAIKGVAESIIDIYDYYKNLRLVYPEANLKLNELKVVTSATTKDDGYVGNLLIEKDADRLYGFEISNTDVNFATTNNTGAGAQNTQPTGNEIEIIKKGSSQPSNGNPVVDNPSAQMKPAK